MKRPKQVNILGLSHELIYVDKPSDVDIYKRESLWGQIDYWTRTIRIYDHGRLDLLSLALTDVLFRNKWFEKAQTDE